MIFRIALLVCVAFIVNTRAECPVTENPRVVINCLRYISNGLFGAAVQDLEIICTIASDIANCVKGKLGDCVAAHVGKAALDEIANLATNCCPERNKPSCPIRPAVVDAQRCFSADASVTLPNGQYKSIVDLTSGDTVLAYDDRTKSIVSTQLITMLDYQTRPFSMFKQITTASGRHLSLSSSHLLPVYPRGYSMAKDLRVGTTIYTLNSDGVLISDRVSNVTDVVKQGYIAPLTQEGTLIVNDVAASCYATISSHWIAHSVLAPMRWWYELFGASKMPVQFDGVHWFPKILYEIVTFLAPSIIQK